MQHDERLGRHAVGRRAVPQHRHVGREQGFVLGNRDGQMAVDRRPSGAAGDELGRPAQHLFEKRPGVVKLEKPIRPRRLASGSRRSAFAASSVSSGVWRMGDSPFSRSTFAPTTSPSGWR